MKTERLYEFTVLARTLNYSRAAKALFISQSVLSKHIMELEKETGHKLIERNSHNVALTEAGRILSNQAVEIIRLCGHAEHQIKKHTLSSEGRIHIACSLEISHASHVKVFFTRFMERYPHIDLRIDVLAGMPESILREYDVIFSPCTYYEQPENTRMMLVQKHGTYLVLPPAHPLMSHATVGLHQLAGETLIVPYADELFGPYAQNWQLAVRSSTKKINHLPAPNIGTALFMVSLGQGILIAPRYVRNLVSSETFMVAISTPNCCFNEYIYAPPSTNKSVDLFWDEFSLAYSKVDQSFTSKRSDL